MHCSAEAGSGAMLQRAMLCVLWPYRLSPSQHSLNKADGVTPSHKEWQSCNQCALAHMWPPGCS